MTAETTLTGYPSIDKPWLSKYPEFVFSNRKTYKSIYENLRAVWTDPDEMIINFYDTHITTETFFRRIDQIKTALYAMGIREGDSIAIALESVPEFLELFLACEQLGCSVKNHIESVESGIGVIRSCTADIYITQDYITQADVDLIYHHTHINHIILVDPLFSVVDFDGVRENIRTAVQERYTGTLANDVRNIHWGDFLKMGTEIGQIPVPGKNNILLSAFTSGTSGEPKEVLHTAESLMGVINQLAMFPFHKGTRDTWLLTILPPTLVAVIVAMMFYPLADGKRLILNPFCKLEDLDVELMHFEPNCWGLIPIFFNTLLESKRIPEDYDMSFFKLFGFGAEPMTNKFIARVQEFLDKHNCQAPFSSGYGQSEGGSDFTVCIGREMIASGSAGMPLIDTVISIFEPGTARELSYGQVGEICKAGPGIMVGYSDSEKTKEVLKLHEDGQIWLHTGDYGFMIPEGLLFVLGRAGIHTRSGKMVYPLGIENKVLTYPGIKEAIVVSGKDTDNPGFDAPYLFIIPESEQGSDVLVLKLKEYIKTILTEEELPQKVYVIEKKPINHFKTDRRFLQKVYNLI